MPIYIHPNMNMCQAHWCCKAYYSDSAPKFTLTFKISWMIMSHRTVSAGTWMAVS